jgi:nucleoid-associated protein YgaU
LWKFIVPAVVIAIAIAAVLIFLPEPEIADRGDPPAVQRSEAPPARAPETARPAAPAPSTGESPAKAGDVAVEQDDTLQAPRILPTFDVVRVTRDGNAVIAGRAAPGAQVTVLDKGEPLGTVTADPRGEWVLIPQRQLEPGARELSIQAQGEDDSPVESEQVVVLAVPERDNDGVTPGQPLAVLTPRTGEGASRVLQGPGAAQPRGEPPGGVSIDVVDYDAKGNVVISGRGRPEAEVRAYADGRLVGVSKADAAGDWVLLPAESLRPGTYELRVDQVRTGGRVIARASTPFTRVEPERIIVREGQVIVQPGNSLWRIARVAYGTGVRFTVIYEANKDQIGNPDLIYPGQVFEIPQTN